MKDYLFTSESVTEGHPDKVCDQISDAILDEVLSQDPNGSITICCQDYQLRHILGSLKVQKYTDIIEGLEAKQVRDSMAGELDYKIICRHCVRAV